MNEEAVKPFSPIYQPRATVMQIPPVERTQHWRTQGADLYSTGASGAVPVRPIHAPNPVESMDRLGEGAIVKTPDKPSAAESPNRDWTEVKKQDTVKEPEEPPKEPIYKVLLEHLREMWRASGSAIELAQDINKITLAERMAQQAKDEPLTYADPAVKRTGSR